MSDSEDEYGPPLPPGLSSKGQESESSDDQFGPPLPKKSKTTRGDNVIGPLLPAKGENPSSYTSDSDSSSSASSGSNLSSRKKKSHESKKSHQRQKRGEKNSKTSSSFIGPCLPGSATSESSDKTLHTSIGPSLPPELSGSVEQDERHREGHLASYEIDDDDDDYIGPSVYLQASDKDCSAAADFESRSQKMLKQLTKTSEPELDKDQPTQRESWMTELPDQIGVSFGLSNRQFRTKDAQEIDSSWTETPQDKEKKSKEKKKKSKRDYVPTDSNAKAAKEIEEYNKKHRPKSLLEMHQKKLEKKKKKDKKKNKDKKPERRPFDRDVDLKVNRLDDAQRKAIIKRSQDLGSRFKTGGMGTSFM